MQHQPGALLFDLGGVVIDVDFGRAFSTWAKAAGTDPQQLEERFRFDEAYERHERGEIDAPAYFAHLRSQLKVDVSDAQLEQGWCAIYVGEIAGIGDTLSDLSRRLPLYAFTNSNPTHERIWASRYDGLLKVFRSVYNSSSLGCRKPEAAAFHVVAERMGFPPHEILFFDDLQQNVDGAIAAGLRAACVTSPEQIETALAG